jgi:hypothetical protein
MLPSFGPNIGTLPRPLTLVRDLEEFEGPILSELRASEGGVFLEKWCARDEHVTRTLIVRSDQRVVAQYLAGRVSMHALLVQYSDGVGFIVDKSGDETRAVYIAHVPALPEKYLPSPSAFHDETLRPEWALTPQNFLLDTRWNGKLLADIERLYLNAYAFEFFMSENAGISPPPHILDFVYNGGFSYMHAFRALRGEIPPTHRARAAGVSANSPGVFTIDAPTATARRVLGNMLKLVGGKKSYDNVHQWSKLKPEKASEVVSASAVEQLRHLAAYLTIDPKKLLPPLVTQAPEDIDQSKVLVAGKLLASYYHHLSSLFLPMAGVEFLGPGPPSEELLDLEDDEEDEDPPFSLF